MYGSAQTILIYGFDKVFVCLYGMETPIKYMKGRMVKLEYAIFAGGTTIFLQKKHLEISLLGARNICWKFL